LLLDMDGVLVDSSGAVDDHWSQWAERRGIDRDAVLAIAHGSPTKDVVARFVAADEVAAETAWVEGLELGMDTEHALPGALAAMTQRQLPVAVVTSASRAVALARLRRAGLPGATVLVSADDVRHGKPDAEPYQRAARLLAVPIADCVGIEDSPAGLASLQAAGASALAVSTTYPPARLRNAVAVLANLAALRYDDRAITW
jgi:sugar-phosphatase